MDTVNQARTDKNGVLSNCNDMSRPYDDISGYTMAEVWAQLENSRSLDGLCTGLYNAYIFKPARRNLQRFFDQFRVVKGCRRARLKGRDPSVLYDGASVCANTFYPRACPDPPRPDPPTTPDPNKPGVVPEVVPE